MAEQGKGNKKTKHWAYAPPLSLSRTAWTPKVVLFLFVIIIIIILRIFLLSVGSGPRPGQSGRLHQRRQIQWLGIVVTRYFLFVEALTILTDKRKFKPSLNPQIKSSLTLHGRLIIQDDHTSNSCSLRHYQVLWITIWPRRTKSSKSCNILRKLFVSVSSWTCRSCAYTVGRGSTWKSSAQGWPSTTNLFFVSAWVSLEHLLYQQRSCI